MTEWSRRQFLLRSGWLAGGVTVLTSCRLLPVIPTFGEPEPGDALTWVQMRADGRVRFFCPRAEMGQGISTGLVQVVAEELVLPNGAIDCVYPTTDQVPPTAMTVGSQSIEQFFEPTARAAATLRDTLRGRAAEARDIEPERLESVEGGVRLPDGATLTYAELIEPGEETLVSPDPALENVMLFSRRPLSERESVGKLREPVHIERIVTGAEVYSRDVRLEGMAFGAVARPPYLGAELEGHDRNAALAVPGVVAVVDGPANRVGVVAETPMTAEHGRRALTCRWSELDAQTLERIQSPLDVDRAIEEGGLDHRPVDEGDLEAGRAAAAKHLDVRYDTPMVAHACMEPRSGVARFQDGRCEIWTGSQDPWFVRGHAARATGLSTSDITVHNQRIGGAFGGRSLCQASIEAAWLAQGSGRPVKVQWSRQEEFRFNYVGPQFSHRIEAGVSPSGEIAYWHHRMVGSPILASSTMVPEHLHWVADIPADPGTWRGAEFPYAADNVRVDFADVRKPMPSGPWRGLGAAPNTFAVECAVDELAQLSGADPLVFRARHAKHERLTRVIEEVRDFAGWQPDRDRRGIAVTSYKGATFVAVVAQVDVAGDVPRVERLWCVQDCGLAVCPDQVRAQIEGNLVWGISMVLHEEFRLEDGIGATVNFDTYPIARNSDVPRIDVRIVESELAPSGSGEAAFAPAAAAIVNAIARARGERPRALPLRKRA